MSKRQQKVQIQNAYLPLMCMGLEPWGEDYWLQQGETFEVVVEEPKDDFHFHVEVSEREMVNVWVEGGFTSISVRHDGQVLECGHNRPPEQ